MSPAVEVPLDILQQLSDSAEALGITLPGVVRMAPTIDPGQDIRMLAQEIGSLLAGRNIFLRGGVVGTVDEETGEWEVMSPKRFTSWVEGFCKFLPNPRKARNSISMEDAVQILAADLFRSRLRPLDTIHKIRMPVVRKDGKIEFLEKGYDAESRIYTVETLKYEMDWPVEQAVQFLNEHGEGYPLAWPEGVEPGNLLENRSWSVQIAAILGTYCRAMFSPGTTRPMFAYLANQAGTGKSTLVAMALNPVFGSSATTKTPRDDDKMNSEIETIARVRRPYVFFDDIGFGMFSTPLNRFITSARHAGRIMGANAEFFDEPAVTQVFATGNGLKISTDLMRRGLYVDLFLAGEVRGRKFAKIITPAYLSREDVRAKFLAASCALVKNYIARTAELPADARGVPNPLPSFEEWTNVIGAMVVLAGYLDPTTVPELSTGGDEDEDEIRELLIKIASESPTDCSFDRPEIVTKARRFGLLESLVGITGEKDIDPNTGKKLGRQLQRWRGRELVDSCGRRFRFGKGRGNKGAKYPLTFLSGPSPGKAAPVTPPPEQAEKLSEWE